MTAIVILTGAGISAESGIQTFRGTDGLWQGHNIDDVCTPQALEKDPALVHRFYDERRASLTDVAPNAAHFALARLEREWQGDFLIITQNVDDLHERAGSKKVLHMHGELKSALCAACGERTRWYTDLPVGLACDFCRLPALRPDVVFFSEMPYGSDRIFDALDKVELFVSIGTSGVVHPAAGFVNEAILVGAKTVELNLARSLATGIFDEVRSGPATQIVPSFVDDILANIALTRARE